MDFVWMIWIEAEQDESPYVAETAEAAVMYCIKAIIQQEDYSVSEKAWAVKTLMESYEMDKNDFGAKLICYVSREPVIRANKEG